MNSSALKDSQTTAEDISKLRFLTFYSEGFPYDKGIPLKNQMFTVRHLVAQAGHNFMAFSPSRLKAIGASEVVREYPLPDLKNNFGLMKIGMGAWKPLIILLALEDLREDEVLFYNDVNFYKYKSYYQRIGVLDQMAEKALSNGVDFFTQREFIDQGAKAYHFSHRLQFEEIAGGTEFAKQFPLCNVSPIIVRPTLLSRQILLEWLMLCRMERFILPLTDESPHPEFRHFTPEQAILNMLLIRWIQEGKLPSDYPGLSYNRGIHPGSTDNAHVNYLKNVKKSRSKRLGSTLVTQFKSDFENTLKFYESVREKHRMGAHPMPDKWLDFSVPVNKWRAADGGVLRQEQDRDVILSDSPRPTYHLMRTKSEFFSQAKIRLEIVAKPLPTCNTGLHIQHWGGGDVCTFGWAGVPDISSSNQLISMERYSLDDGYFMYIVVFYNFHYTVSIGAGKPNGYYEGSGRDQYKIRNIKISASQLLKEN